MIDPHASKRARIAALESRRIELRAAVDTIIRSASGALGDGEAELLEELNEERTDVDKTLRFLRETLEIDIQHVATMRQYGVGNAHGGDD